jgi:Forkhead domain
MACFEENGNPDWASLVLQNSPSFPERKDMNKPPQTDVLECSLTDMEWLRRVKSSASINSQPPTLDIVQPQVTPALTTNNNNNNFIEKNTTTSSTDRIAEFDEDINQTLEKMKAQVAQTNGRPTFSYSTLIAIAIKHSKKGKVTLGELYQWIMENFPYYKIAGPTWRNSIRHNLSFNKLFVRIPREPADPGKGAYWGINTQLDKVNLLNTQSTRRQKKRKRSLADSIDAADESDVDPTSPYTDTSSALPSATQSENIHTRTVQLPSLLQIPGNPGFSHQSLSAPALPLNHNNIGFLPGDSLSGGMFFVPRNGADIIDHSSDFIMERNKKSDTSKNVPSAPVGAPSADIDYLSKLN